MTKTSFHSSAVSAVRHIDAARLFEAAARRFASRPAVVSAHARCTYAELLERTGRIAAGLHALGVGPGERVVLMLPNGLRFIECWWGVVRAGAVVVPINPRAPHEELVKILSSAGACALVLEDRTLPEDQALLLRKRFPAMRVIQHAGGTVEGAVDLEALVAHARPIVEADPLSLDAPCAMYYTAGSTGRPKGVLRSQQSVVWGLAMLARRLAPSHVLLARAPMAHTGGSLTGPFAILIAGGTLALPESGAVEDVLGAVARHRVTHLYVHPTIFAKGLLARLDAAPACDTRSLQRLQWTAGPLPEPVRAALFARFPSLPLEVTFGMTEASNIATHEYGAPPAHPVPAANCVGYPLPGAELRVVGADGRALDPGAEGEVAIRTPTAFDGYWMDPESTAAAVTADGWLLTGDIGFLDADGALHLNGRRREIIKTGGMTVHPAEVEQALAEHPDVMDAVVFGQPHADWDEAVVAAVCLRASSQETAREIGVAELIAHCRLRLAPYKLPKSIHFLPELPRNGSGKVDKRRVAALLAPTSEPA
jgi:acyl-CoA synthetase (AMP-forming)/AMP-acid ligase II